MNIDQASLGTKAFALGACLATLAAYPADGQLAQRLLPGDYRLTGPGVFRRVVVSNSKIVLYDIWRIRSNASVEHLHFDLISPTQLPVASYDYSIRLTGKICGTTGLHNYVDSEGFVHPAIMIMHYRGAEQPLSSGAQPLTEADYVGDRSLIGDIKRSAEESHSYYSSLSTADRKALSAFVPQCKK